MSRDFTLGFQVSYHTDGIHLTCSCDLQLIELAQEERELMTELMDEIGTVIAARLEGGDPEELYTAPLYRSDVVN